MESAGFEELKNSLMNTDEARMVNVFCRLCPLFCLGTHRARSAAGFFVSNIDFLISIWGMYGEYVQ